MSALAKLKGAMGAAAPLLAAGAAEGVGAQVRLALVARLFDEVARGHANSGNISRNVSNVDTTSRASQGIGRREPGGGVAGSAALAPTSLARSTEGARASRADELLACAAALCDEVACIEARAPARETQSRSFESALPGLRNFTARLERAAAMSQDYAAKPPPHAAAASVSPASFAGAAAATIASEEESNKDAAADAADAGAASRMLAEFEVHLRHLLTFPSAQACKALDLDLGRWEATHASTNGLGRRRFAPRPGGAPSAAPNSGATAVVVERPFVHSDLEPHPPVYQAASDAASGVLASLGRDRLLRVWDLRTGTPLRALPVPHQDAPLATARGVVVCVAGDRGRSFLAWATPRL